MFWQHIINNEEPADHVEFDSIGGTNDWLSQKILGSTKSY